MIYRDRHIEQTHTQRDRQTDSQIDGQTETDRQADSDENSLFQDNNVGIRKTEHINFRADTLKSAYLSAYLLTDKLWHFGINIDHSVLKP